MRLHRIKNAAAACLILILVLNGCGAPPLTEEVKEEDPGVTSMEEEPDLAYEVPVSLPNILVNQLGYITNGTKMAVFRRGEVSADFYVIEADTGETAFVGVLEKDDLGKTEEDPLYYGDFSALTQPGTYYLEAPFLGRSYTFQVANDLYTPVLREACRQYYYNRCGMSLTSEFAGGRAHNACHTGNAMLREDISVSMNVSGGWHQDEAGSKEVVKAAENIGVLLLAYELYGSVFGDDMGIPESGNDIPDILDEVRYEIEWLLKMQDPVSGTVYSGVTVYEQGAGKGTVSYVEPADMEAVKAFAAVLAKFSYLYQKYDNTFATDCLKASDRAWKYVELNGKKELKEADPWKFTAATELYRASGLSACHRFVTEYLKQIDSGGELEMVTFLGYVTYISTKQSVKLDLCERITKELMQKAEEISEEAGGSGYLVEEGEGNEHNLKLLQNMMYLTMVDYMIANHEYDIVIENHFHYLMGRNAQAVCYIDGEEQNIYTQTDEAMGIMKQFGADSKLIFMLSEIVGGHAK